VCCSVDDGTTAAPDGKTCSSDEFTCGDGTCIPLSQRCDWTEYHCPDGTDEFDCRMSFTLNNLTPAYFYSLGSMIMRYWLLPVVCVCMSMSVTSQNGWTSQAGLWQGGFLSSVLPVLRQFGYLQK